MDQVSAVRRGLESGDAYDPVAGPISLAAGASEVPEAGRGRGRETAGYPVGRPSPVSELSASGADRNNANRVGTEARGDPPPPRAGHHAPAAVSRTCHGTDQ